MTDVLLLEVAAVIEVVVMAEEELGGGEGSRGCGDGGEANDGHVSRQPLIKGISID